MIKGKKLGIRCILQPYQNKQNEKQFLKKSKLTEKLKKKRKFESFLHFFSENFDSKKALKHSKQTKKTEVKLRFYVLN